LREIGVIQADHRMTNPRMPLQVASVQTLARRRIPSADLVLIDEAHRWYDFYSEWMGREEWRRIPFIGLSATPWTKGLGKHYDDLVIAATTADLIAAKHLAPFRVFAPSHPDLSEVRTVAGDYHEGDLSKVMDKGPLTANIVKTWLAKGEGRPTLLFAVDRAHAQSLCERFQGAGVSAEYADANTLGPERSGVQRRDLHHGHRLAVRVLHHPGASDAKRNALLADDRPRIADLSRQD
jgi:superfamily II DNA or RNA helicase